MFITDLTGLVWTLNCFFENVAFYCGRVFFRTAFFLDQVTLLSLDPTQKPFYTVFGSTSKAFSILMFFTYSHLKNLITHISLLTTFYGVV